jgi:hypothetical protein
MGFFSWKTQDTDKSIANKYSIRRTFRVQMMDNKGNVWTEDDYDGYGVFGGKDYYELLAEMNGVTSVYEGGEKYTFDMRQEGISLAFGKNNGSGVGTDGVYYPNLVEQADGWVYQMSGPDSCDEQGFFYGDDDEDENNDMWDDEEDYES